MATNKHAIIRYQALDKCFSNCKLPLFVPFHVTAIGTFSLLSTDIFCFTIKFIQDLRYLFDLPVS